MQRPSELSFDGLNGEEILEILHTRFWDLLHDLPELQRRFVLTQAKLRLEIVLDIWGATPPRKVYHDSLVVRTTDEPPVGGVSAEAHHDLVAEVDARTNPPDLIREEHGLQLPRAVRGQSGVTETSYVEPEDQPKYPKPPQPTPTHLLPAQQASPTMKRDGRRVYAGWVEQDYGSLQAGERKGDEGPIVGAEKIAESGGGGADHAPVQVDFRVGSYHGQDTEKPKVIVQETIERGLKIDKELAQRNRPSGGSAPPPKKHKKA